MMMQQNLCLRFYDDLHAKLTRIEPVTMVRAVLYGIQHPSNPVAISMHHYMSTTSGGLGNLGSDIRGKEC